MSPWSRALGLALLLALPRGTAHAEGPRFSWSASAGVDGGYDDNVTISPFARPGERQPSATAGVAAEMGGRLTVGAFSTGLSYELDQTFYFSYRELDMQSHGLGADLELSLGPVAVSPEYSFAVNARVPTAGVLHSLEHTGKLQLDATLHNAVHAIVDYELTFYDVRDEAYAYLGGTQHVARAYPRFFLFDAVLLALGYRLEITQLGTTEDTLTRGAGETTVELPLSYVGHFGFLSAFWEPHPSVSLLLLLKAGRKDYEPFAASGGSGSGKGGEGLSSRSDTLVRVNSLASWMMLKRLSLEANFVFEASESSVSTRRLTGSYTNLIATLGLSYDYSSDE